MRANSKTTKRKKKLTKIKRRKRSVSNVKAALPSTRRRSMSDMKASLSRTRKIISNKFRKLRQQQISSEKRNTTKLSPLTESLKKIISKREEIRQNDLNPIPEVNMEIEPVEDIEMGEVELELPEPIFPPPELPQRSRIRESAPPPIPPLPIRRRKAQSPLPQRSPPPPYDLHPPTPSTRNKSSKADERNSNEDVRQFFNNLIQNGGTAKKGATKRRVRNDSNDSEKDIFNADNKETNRKTRKHETIPMDSIDFEYDSDDSAHGFDANVQPLARSFSPLQNKQQSIHLVTEPNETSDDDERMVISPDDYDDFGEYQFPGVKRSKLQLDQENIDKSLRRIKYDFIPYNPNIVYEYYDDPNELCDRLKLLVASKGAGNTNHSQEINSIVEELRERGIVA